MTAAELRTEVLVRLGIVAQGQAASAEDADIVDKAITSIFDQLKATHLASFSTSAIPEWAQLPLEKYITGQVAPKFGVSGQRLMEIMSVAKEGWRDFERQLSGREQNMVTEARYY